MPDFDQQLRYAESSHSAGMQQQEFNLKAFTEVERVKMEWLKAKAEYLLKMEEVYKKRIENAKTWYQFLQFKANVRKNRRAIRKAEKALAKQIRSVKHVERLWDGVNMDVKHARAGWKTLGRWLRFSDVVIPSSLLMFRTRKGEPVGFEFPVSIQEICRVAAKQHCRVDLAHPHFALIRNAVQAASQMLKEDAIEYKEDALREKAELQETLRLLEVK